MIEDGMMAEQDGLGVEEKGRVYKGPTTARVARRLERGDRWCLEDVLSKWAGEDVARDRPVREVLPDCLSKRSGKERSRLGGVEKTCCLDILTRLD
jgi:hypothetical protein